MRSLTDKEEELNRQGAKNAKEDKRNLFLPWRSWRLGDSPSSISEVRRHDLAAGPRRHDLQSVQRDAAAHEPHRSIRHADVRARPFGPRRRQAALAAAVDVRLVGVEGPRQV